MSKLKVIVAGGRDFTNYRLTERVLDHLLQNHERKDVAIVCGEARGADAMGRRYAEDRGISIDSHPANWDELGLRAGHIRNAEMAKVGTHLVAFWDSKSKGTKGMINIAKKKGLIVKVYNYNGSPIDY